MGIGDLINRPWVFRHLYKKMREPGIPVQIRFLVGFGRNPNSFEISAERDLSVKLRTYLQNSGVSPAEIEAMCTVAARDVGELYDDPRMYVALIRQLGVFERIVRQRDPASQRLMEAVVGFDYMGEETNRPFCPFALDQFIN